VQSSEQWQPAEGMDVYGADGEKLGQIVAIDTNSIMVEKGFFFPKDYYIPRTAIASIDGENVYLLVGKDEALQSGWDEQQFDEIDAGVSAPDTMMATGAGGTSIPTSGGGAWLGNAGMASEEDSALASGTADRSYDASRVPGEVSGTVGGAYDTASGDTGVESDSMRIPVHEEELTATKRPVEYGEVRVDKTIVEEPRTLDVPVTEERVRVTRRTVDRESTGGDVFREETIDVPIRGEEVDVQKRTRVSEEVEVSKQAVQKSVHVDDTVRREVVDVADQTGRATDASGGRRASTSDKSVVDKAKDALGIDDTGTGEAAH